MTTLVRRLVAVLLLALAGCESYPANVPFGVLMTSRS